MIKIKVKEAKEENKWPKEAALYIFKPESGYVCGECVFYNNKKCNLFSDAEKIDPNGSCNLFVHGHAKDYTIGRIGVLTKLLAGYEDPQGGFSCKNCEYFLTANDCKKVDKTSEGDTPGMIHPEACCNRWEKND